MKRQVIIERELATTVDVVWAKVTDLDEYPRYFKYITRAEKTEMKVGGTWHDWTNIVFLPMKIEHSVTRLDPRQQLDFAFSTPFGGRVSEAISFTDLAPGTRLYVQIDIDLRITDFLFGRLLARRLSEMIHGALDKLEREVLERESAPQSLP
jgi:uncharacterized protein YndB with AHSA1/START domain